MDPGTGRIYDMGQMEEAARLQKIADEGLVPLTDEQATELKGVEPLLRMSHMRNMPCTCGSGVKFKRCCLPAMEKR